MRNNPKIVQKYIPNCLEMWNSFSTLALLMRLSTLNHKTKQVMTQFKTNSFYSSLVRHPECTYYGVYGQSSYFEFSNGEQTLTIRFYLSPLHEISNSNPFFVNAELNCNKTGDMIEYTTRELIAKKYTKLLGNISFSS